MRFNMLQTWSRQKLRRPKVKGRRPVSVFLVTCFALNQSCYFKVGGISGWPFLLVPMLVCPVEIIDNSLTSHI